MWGFVNSEVDSIFLVHQREIVLARNSAGLCTNGVHANRDSFGLHINNESVERGESAGADR